MSWKFTIDAHNADRRVDHFLRSTFLDIPLSTLHKWIRKGHVRINGLKTTPSYKLKEGDELTAPQKPTPKTDTRKYSAPDINNWILFENKNVLILNKPAGVPSQPGGKEPSAIEGIWKYLGDNRSPGFRAALINRLDKDTSGILLAAKTGRALRSLSAAIKNKRFKKIYIAVAQGTPQKTSGSIQIPLTGHKNNRQTYARTDYKVLGKTKSVCLLEVTLHTGRKHQIRKHLSAKDMPILGDTKYGGKKEDRLMLHAWKLIFPLNDKESDKTIIAPPDEKFITVLRRTGLLTFAQRAGVC